MMWRVTVGQGKELQTYLVQATSASAATAKMVREVGYDPGEGVIKVLIEQAQAGMLWEKTEGEDE